MGHLGRSIRTLLDDLRHILLAAFVAALQTDANYGQYDDHTKTATASRPWPHTQAFDFIPVLWRRQATPSAPADDQGLFGQSDLFA